MYNSLLVTVFNSINQLLEVPVSASGCESVQNSSKFQHTAKQLHHSKQVFSSAKLIKDLSFAKTEKLKKQWHSKLCRCYVVPSSICL